MGRRIAVAAAVGVAFAASAQSANAGSVRWMKGVVAPGTPKRYDRVGVLEFGPKTAKNVLVLNPGTSAGAGYFAPLARTLVKSVKGWQVWSVERRENLLEDQSVLERAKRGKATAKQMFDYYLGWLTDSTITKHIKLIPDSSVAFPRKWGMRVEIGDLRRVVKAAEARGGKVVVGGHSLGGSITTAYATWDFNGKAGADGLSGLVYIDGGSSPTPVTPDVATQELQTLQTSSPWLSFGGIPSPFLGLFSATGSTATKIAPNARSLGQTFPLLPANLKPPVPVTNEAEFGYSTDTDTSPSNLIAAQVHAGQLAASGDPRGWVRAGDITPIQRWASMLSGWGLSDVDGTAWYHPMRLTIDSGAVGDGNANPAQRILGVRATHGDDVHVPIYAFGAALGGQRVLAAAKTLAAQSHLPRRELTLVNRQGTYAHNDPSAAFPRNAFVAHLIPFLDKIGRQG